MQRAGGDRSTGGEIWKHEHPHIIAGVTGDDDVVNQTAHVRDERRPEWTDAHPGSGRQLEVLRETPLEHESLRRIRRVDQRDGVAHAEKSVGVE